jgi:hypothetical protein
VPAIVFPAGFDLSTVIAPRMFFASSDRIPRRRLMSAARGQNERENKITFPHERGNLADFRDGKIARTCRKQIRGAYAPHVLRRSGSEPRPMAFQAVALGKDKLGMV